jgi:hypothetical protein
MAKGGFSAGARPKPKSKKTKVEHSKPRQQWKKTAT